MTEQNTPTPPPAADQNAPVVNPQAVYIKDCSFEALGGPFVAGLEGQGQRRAQLAVVMDRGRCSETLILQPSLPPEGLPAW